MNYAGLISKSDAIAACSERKSKTLSHSKTSFVQTIANRLRAIPEASKALSQIITAKDAELTAAEAKIKSLIAENERLQHELNKLKAADQK